MEFTFEFTRLSKTGWVRKSQPQFGEKLKKLKLRQTSGLRTKNLIRINTKIYAQNINFEKQELKMVRSRNCQNMGIVIEVAGVTVTCMHELILKNSENKVQRQETGGCKKVFYE